MRKPFETIGITMRSDSPRMAETLHKILKILKQLKRNVRIDGKRCLLQSKGGIETYDDTSSLDLLIVIGGDGTILRSVREMKNFDVPVLSINRGTIGFLTEMTVARMETMLRQFLSGKGKIEKRSLLHVVAMRGKKKLIEGKVLNEAVIAQGAISRLIDLKTCVNGDPLAVFHADGVIIATPTGSTAYSLAAGGPIVHPQMRATILTPINPHSFTQKPLVLPAENEIEVTIMTKKSRFSDVHVSLTLDGQTYVTLERGDIVRAKIAKETVQFLRLSEETFFSTLRSKLKWGERLEGVEREDEDPPAPVKKNRNML